MAQAEGAAVVAAAAERVGRYRWVICALLFSATAINYIDRQMIGVLEPNYLRPEFHWSESDYSRIVIWFQLAYAFGYIGFVRQGGRLGRRAVRLFARGGGLDDRARRARRSPFDRPVRDGALRPRRGRIGQFPRGRQGRRRLFPAKERALAIGVFNAGSNVGAIITPLIVPAITLAYGWRMAFVLTGVFGVVWLIAWIALYRDPASHARVGAAELAHIRQDPADPAVKPKWLWTKLLARRETWAYALGKFFIDPIWWFYLFWLPKFLNHQYGLDLVHFAAPVAAIYILSDVGSIAGGWMSSAMLRRGASANRARKLTMLICAVAILPIVFTQYITNVWIDVLIIGLAAAGHRLFRPISTRCRRICSRAMRWDR